MLRALKLLIPVIIPSWRFFDTIAPSPRIEFLLLKHTHETSDNWHKLRPRPLHVPIKKMVKRLFWNPQWNDTLFLVSCAERLADYPTQHSENEIFKRIRLDIKQTNVQYIQFRLVFIKRMNNNTFEKQIMFTSSIEPYDKRCQ